MRTPDCITRPLIHKLFRKAVEKEGYKLQKL